MDFNKLVKNIIGSTLDLFDFRLKSEITGLLEYEHKVLVISISYDYRRSYEVDVNFMFKSIGESYTYDELKEYLGYEKKEKYDAIQITHESALRMWVENAQIFLEENLKMLIDDHIKVSFELDGLRRQRMNEHANQKRDQFLIADVERLWKQKDYHGLVELLKDRENEIGGSMKKKYEYALKMIDKN